MMNASIWTELLKSWIGLALFINMLTADLLASVSALLAWFHKVLGCLLGFTKSWATYLVMLSLDITKGYLSALCTQLGELFIRQ
ncbi:uncharacterized protein PHALS_09292 [Plasmopara halstedii]|uniref:Uncharacterized protein n=1 Tax=Plasmopara halstedii TaxID=4781 RepID=A0A0P1AF65_PLAHL|nr:uncharacterized protein PHALS_09292 [Plasmopara halstedii]CEG39239.1 hypothetical protein PHALS_09292 [Plasmopara halstedii]|eukprot:XP_024575608.1 hypothetical protein PHALS_09292 [Plasmopara halstedii]